MGPDGAKAYKAAYIIKMCLEVVVYKKLAVITESTT